MATLSNQEKAIIQENPIGCQLDSCLREFEDNIIPQNTLASYVDIINSAPRDKAVRAFILEILRCLISLHASRELPSHNTPSEILCIDISHVMSTFARRGLLNTQAAAAFLTILVDRGGDQLIWSAVYELVSNQKTPPTGNGSLPDRSLRDLHHDWHRAYLPDSLDALQLQMEECLKDKSEYYAKTIVFVQSSGMGKSRLADMFGRFCPMINFILREKGDGYPPPDSKIIEFMRESPRGDASRVIIGSPVTSRHETPGKFREMRVAAVWNHSLAVGLLQASLETLNAWVKSQDHAKTTQELARARQELMAPLDPDAQVPEGLEDRSSKRSIFCEEVVEKATKIRDDLVLVRQWRNCFDNENPSSVRQHVEKSLQIQPLRRAARELLDELSKFRDWKPTDSQLVMVFDEATTLFTGPGKADTGRYVALTRIFSILKEFPVWFFVLSTESMIEKLFPSDRPSEDKVGDYATAKSDRGTDDKPPRKLRLFPPFVALRLDVEDRRRWRDPETRAMELAKPMAEFASPEHMAMFGRPLWMAYDTPEKMYTVAKSKLIGGGNATFNPIFANHVFAVLSFRLSLDVCLENPKTLPIVRTAVDSHLRLVISMDQPTGVLHTVTPSEPVLARSAMELLCHMQYWAVAIGTFTNEFLKQGVIDKGIKGELCSRLVLILAHDWLRWGASLRAQGCPTFAPTFTVEEFLTSLYAKEYHGAIRGLPTQLRQARMNFTHFVSTSENLYPNVIEELCHDLLRSSAALQLAPAQPTYDKLIPIYFGEEGDSFNLSRCGVIMVQDKNRATPTTVRSIFNEHFTAIDHRTGKPKPNKPQAGKSANRRTAKRKKTEEPALRENNQYFVFNEMKHPVLFLLFDMRVNPINSPPIEVSYSIGNNPPVWAIHSRGHSKQVFGCLENMDPGEQCEAFFLSAMEDTGMYADIARENMAFHKLAREFRRPEPSVDEDGGTGMGDGRQEIEEVDEDTQMEDA
ncbi:MAG: hypothetical protein M1839_006121 [Geoglossum umbratile]|nr:MAG: hypothetical protein M1839_006121 [Geoglossum umbratile]